MGRRGLKTSEYGETVPRNNISLSHFLRPHFDRRRREMSRRVHWTRVLQPVSIYKNMRIKYKVGLHRLLLLTLT